MDIRTPTPGPWRYDPERRQIVTEDGRDVTAPGGLDPPRYLGEIDGNGALMAAAPDLLAALEAARGFIMGARLAMNDGRYGILDQIGAAISKTRADRRTPLGVPIRAVRREES